MKTLSLTTITLLISFVSAHATGLGILPKCTDSEVRLSKKPIKCIPDQLSDDMFQIPEIELDFEDVDNIFEGAESSGGHGIAPMGRQNTHISPYHVIVECELRRVADGNKRISFLSKQYYSLSSSISSTVIIPKNWRHFLIEGNDIDSKKLIPINMTPNIDEVIYKSFMTYRKEKDQFSLKLCISKTHETICSQENFQRSDNKVNVTLYTGLKTMNKFVQKTTKASCQIH